MTQLGPELDVVRARPEITHDESVTEIENPALRKIAEDVADAINYSLTAVAADDAMEVRGDSLEADFKTGLASMAKTSAQANLRANAREQATAILNADATSLGAIFGRHPGEVDSAPAFARQGFERALEATDGVDIRLEDLGIGTPSLTVPLRRLEQVDGGLLIPGEKIPAEFEGSDFEDIAQDSLDRAVGDGVLDVDRFSEMFGASYEGDPWADGAQAGSDFEAAAVSMLDMRIRRVKCEDETNPEFWGNDEIALGGVSIDEDGDTKKINERYVGGGFKDGRSKTLNWDYHTFNLNERNFWPKKYGVTLILAEKDNGGFSDFLSKLWSKVKDAVLAAIKKAAAKAGMALAAWLGLPAIGPVIGKILGEVAAWIINKVFGWLIKLFKDDIFKPYTAWLSLPSKSARWKYSNGTWGSKVSPVLWVRYHGFGGRYRLDYQWRLR